MIKFISDNWQLITAFAGAILFLYRQVIATRKGVRALLRATSYACTINTMMISDIARYMLSSP